MKFKLTPRQCAHIINETFTPLLVENKKSSVLLTPEQEISNVELLKMFGSLHMDNYVSPQVIKNILKNRVKISLGSNFNFSDLIGIIENSNNMDDKIRWGKVLLRFTEYFERFKKNPDGRGFAFEGFIAGIFGGEVRKEAGKGVSVPDVTINNKNYSVKSLDKETGDRFDLGRLKNALDYYLTDGDIEVSGVTTVEKVKSLGKKRMAEFLFKYYNGELKQGPHGQVKLDGFIFARVMRENIHGFKYYVIPTRDVIDFIINDNDIIKKDRSNGAGFALNPDVLIEKPNFISFPKYNEVIDSLTNVLLGFRNDKKHPLNKIFNALRVDAGRYDKINFNQISKYIRPEVLAYFDEHSDKIGKNLINHNKNL